MEQTPLSETSGATRYMSIYQIPSLFDQFEEKLKLARSLHLPKFTMQEIPLLLQAGIDVYYASYFLLIEKLNTAWVKGMTDLYEKPKVSSLSHQVLDIMLDVCALDFKRFHRMMMTTSIYGVCAVKNDIRSVSKIMETYRGHPQALFELLFSMQNVYVPTTQRIESVPLFLTLENGWVMRTFLENVNRTALMETPTGQKLFNTLLELFFSKPKLIFEFDTLLKKILVDNGHIRPDWATDLFENRAAVLKKNLEQNYAYCQSDLNQNETNGVTRVHFKAFYLLCKYAKSYEYADLLQSFFVKHIKPDFLQAGIQELSASELKTFYDILQPPTFSAEHLSAPQKVALKYLTHLTYGKEGTSKALLYYLHSRHLITEPEVLRLFQLQKECNRPVFKYRFVHAPDPIEPFNDAYYNYVASFETADEAAEHIDRNLDFFIASLQANPPHMLHLLKRFGVFFYWVHHNHPQAIQKVYKTLPKPGERFYRMFLRRDTKGNTLLHEACRKGMSDILQIIENQPESYLMEAFFTPNKQGLIPLDVLNPCLKTWVQTHIPFLSPLLEPVSPQILSHHNFVPATTVQPPTMPHIQKRDIKLLSSFQTELDKIHKKYPTIYKKAQQFITDLRATENIQPILNADWKRAYNMFAHTIGGGRCNFRLAYMIEGHKIVLTKISRRDHIYTELIENGDDLRKRAAFYLQKQTIDKKVLDKGKQNE